MPDIVIITMVGTSILSNFLDEIYNPALSETKRKNLRLQIKSLEKDKSGAPRYFNQYDWDRLERDWEDDDYDSPNSSLKSEIKIWAKNKGNISSAELQSIDKIRSEFLGLNLKVYLLTSNTLDGYLSGSIIAELLKENAVETYLEKIEGLEITRTQNLPNAFDHLFNRIPTIKVQSLETDKVVLNITGGYKATIPYLTIISQFYNIDIYYIYEDSQALVKVTKSVVGVDWDIIERYASFLLNPALINGVNIDKMESLGLIDSGVFPCQLSTLGKIAQVYLQRDLPFQKTTVGYMIEHKLFEYYLKNKYSVFDKIEHSFKLSNKEGMDLADADLCFSNSQNNDKVIAEIKPATISEKALRSKIKNLLASLLSNANINLLELWIVLYEYEGEEVLNDKAWCQRVINSEILNIKPDLIFKIKKTKILKNLVDGNRNRILYHEFLRSEIQQIDDLFSSETN